MTSPTPVFKVVAEILNDSKEWDKDTQSHASGNKEHCNLEVGPGISPSYYECCP